MQSVAALLFVFASTVPAAAASAEMGAAPAAVERPYVGPAACPPAVFRARNWRRWPLPADYFYRPFECRFEFDYPWHAPVRVVPSCPGPILAPRVVPRLSSGASRTPQASRSAAANNR